MKPVYLGMSLLLCAALTACGDGTSPDNANSGTVLHAGGPFDVLAALPPESQPYGLDVYTAKCANCHGNLGQGVSKNPAITGLTPYAMQQKLLAFRAGTKGPHTAAELSLSDADIAAVSIYAGE